MMALIVILSIFCLQDTIEIKTIQGMSYRIFNEQDNLCFQYKAERNWSEPMILDNGNISEYAFTITPGDYLHIAYCKDNRVCYRTTLEPITFKLVKNNGLPKWSTWVFVSPYFTEPVSNISIGFEDKYLYVIWHAPVAGNSTLNETWKRMKIINEPIYKWFTPQCMSIHPSNNHFPDRTEQ